MSTDPAHSLADIFEAKVGDRPTAIRLPGASAKSKSSGAKLYAWQINAEKQFHAFLRPYQDAVLKIIESGTIFSRQEIEPLLNTTLPGMAEVAALLAIHELLHPGKRSAHMEYDHIVVDTAPIGHTLRLFELPEHFSRFLDFLDLAGSRDRWLAQRFGGNGGVSNAFLEDWQKIVGANKDVIRAKQ
jgi:arsenite-transporting ATPase